MIIGSLLSGSEEPSPHKYGNEDHAFPEPGKFDKLDCGICGTEMDVRRNVHGPTGWAEAMSRKGHPHDAFRCPHRDADWHIQAKRLAREIRDTPSQAISQIIHAELCQILNAKVATKKVSKF